jgi:hypothetical protein
MQRYQTYAQMQRYQTVYVTTTMVVWFLPDDCRAADGSIQPGSLATAAATVSSPVGGGLWLTRV